MSKSKSSELVRGAGVAASLWQKLEEAVERNHGLTEDLHLLAQPEGDSIIDDVAKRLVMVGAMQRDAYVVPVNYGLSHQQQIEAGKFDWITDHDNKLIRKNPTEHLVPVPTGEIEQRITLVHLGRDGKTEGVLAEMEKLNHRPTMSTETLAFLATHPGVQCKFPLVGLGTVWVGSDGRRLVLGACEDSDGRNLDLPWCEGGWRDVCLFLAVLKS
jgi:hypothetical protein